MIASCSKKLKQGFTPKKHPLDKPIRYWYEKDNLDGSIVDAYVIILYTRGCSWAYKSGCSMCGYFNDSAWRDIPNEMLIKQFKNALQNYNGEKVLKIFTSGSFLDEIEIPIEVRDAILNMLPDKVEKIIVESRPEYIIDGTLQTIKEHLDDKKFEIGIGLETSDDIIRNKIINKGFTFEDYRESIDIIRKIGFTVKTYILIKPPFLTERESVEDSIKTVQDIYKMTDVISFNPVAVHRRTFVEYLWGNKRYRPPWLWSIIDILVRSKKIVRDMRLQCDVVGGGKTRGAHNCFSCDKRILDAIKNFSLYQDISIFEDISCSCKDLWIEHLELEPLSFGSLPDYPIVGDV